MSTIVPYAISETTLRSDLISESQTLFKKELRELSPYQLDNVISNVIKNKVIASNWEDSLNLGRIVLDVLNNTGLYSTMQKVLEKEGIDIRYLEDVDDTALGNGGLGRLASCFIESAATMEHRLYGVGLYYKNGLFKQSFDSEGRQKEEPDDWTANGESWFTPRHDWAVTVKYTDTEVLAVPYFMPVRGYNKNP